MPREQLLGLASDVGRLLAAGSSAAAGHDGLGRWGRALRELGAKVPTLAAVADAVERVTASAPKQAGPAFLDLVVLARQIRGGLSAAGADGPLEKAPPSGPWQTAAALRDVAPVHEALSQRGSNRDGTVSEAVGSKVVADLRLVSALLGGLEDGYSDLADLVADEALPALGQAVVPDLLARVDVQGKVAEARALRALCKIDKARGAELCRRAVQEGSVPLREQALRLLPDVLKPGEAERKALECCKEKNSEVRAAAVAALRVGSSDEALDTLLGLLQDKDREVRREAEEALEALPHAETTPRLLRELEAVLPTLPLPPKRKPGKMAGKRAVAKATGGRAVSENEQRLERAAQLVRILGERKDGQRAAAARAILPLAGHHEFPLRRAALKALGQIGPVTPEVLPALLEAAQEKDPVVQSAALVALEAVEPARREEAVGRVLDLLEKNKLEDDGRRAAIRLLPPHVERFGPRILAYLPNAVRRADWSTQYVVASALIQIGPAARACVPELLEKVRGGQFSRFIEAVHALDPEGAQAIPAALLWLEDRKARTRLSALHLLRRYGPKAARAADAVRKRLEDQDQWARNMADTTLNAILLGP